MNDCVLGLASVFSAEASLSRREAGEEKIKHAGHDGEGKERSAFCFPLLLFLMGYPAERPRFEKTIRATRKLGGGREGGVRKLLLVWYMVLCCGVDIAVFSSPPRAKAEPRTNERTVGNGAKNRRLRKCFLFLFPLVNLLYYVIC